MNHLQLKNLMELLRQVEEHLLYKKWEEATHALAQAMEQVSQAEQSVYRERVDRYLSAVDDALKDRE